MRLRSDTPTPASRWPLTLPATLTATALGVALAFAVVLVIRPEPPRVPDRPSLPPQTLARIEAAPLHPAQVIAKPSRWRTVQATVTAYCPGACCCGEFADGVTSRGVDARTPGAAVDPLRVPYGSKIYIDELGPLPVIADDTGGAMRNADGIHIDLRMPTHAEALEWGRRTIPVTIYTPEEAQR